MKLKSILLGIVAITLAADCSASGQPDEAAAAKQIARICPVYLRHENSDGTLEPFPFIRPEHVAAITLAKPLYPGNKAIWVQLTSAGSERMYRETKDAVGSRIAFFCGNKELEKSHASSTN